MDSSMWQGLENGPALSSFWADLKELLHDSIFLEEPYLAEEHRVCLAHLCSLIEDLNLEQSIQGQARWRGRAISPLSPAQNEGVLQSWPQPHGHMLRAALSHL